MVCWYYNEIIYNFSQIQEAALDADKLFLAAIDKFNAMMSKSNDYAPEGKQAF